MAGRTIMRIADKEMMDTVLSENHHEVVGIVFNDTFSYQLKFIWGYEIPNMEENSEHAGHSKSFCDRTADISYWNQYEDAAFHF